MNLEDTGTRSRGGGGDYGSPGNRDVADRIHQQVWGQARCTRAELCEHDLKRPGSQGHRRRAAVRCFMEASITLIFAAIAPRVHAPHSRRAIAGRGRCQRS